MTSSEFSVEEITPTELQALLIQDNPPIVLDVREIEEINICALPSYIHIPLGDLTQEFDRLPMDQTIVILCHHGRRSYFATLYLKNHGFSHVLNLKGGIHAWAKEVDSSMVRY